MLHFFHGDYVVLIQPIHLPDEHQWQVRFYIARNEVPTPKAGKIFTFTESYQSEMKTINRSIELATAIIDGNLQGETIDDL